MATEEQNAPQPPKPKLPSEIGGIPLGLLVFIIFNILITASTVGTIAYVKLVYKKTKITEQVEMQKLDEKGKKKDTGESTETMVKIPEVILNISQGESGKQHFAVVEIHLECPSSTLVSELTKKASIVRDIVITAFQKRNYFELTTIRGKLMVKSEIMHNANKVLKAGTITNVFFAKYVVN